MRKLTVILLLSAAMVLSSCMSNYWTMQRSESLKPGLPDKIISFLPILEYRNSSHAPGIYELEQKKQALLKTMLKAAKKNGLNLDVSVASDQKSVMNFDQLLYLRKSIVDAAFENYGALYAAGGIKENELSRSVFIYSPKLPMDVGRYAQSFGSRYYSLVRLQVYQSSFCLQHVIVDTDLGEVVLNERKTIDHELNNALLSQAVYDSYALVTKELKAR